MNFEDWMILEGLSPSTADKYVGAISGSLTKWAQLHQITSAPLDEINDANLFASISEKIITTPEFAVRNKRGNDMYGAALHKYANFLEAIENEDALLKLVAREISDFESEQETSPAYDPDNQDDARRKILRQIVARQGQPKFRARLIHAYDGKCAITCCDVLPVLEAAHITPYLGPTTNLVENGILLRADIHTMWDLHLVAIHPASKIVFVSALITNTAYRQLHGVTATAPVDVSLNPSILALTRQWSRLRKG